MEKFSVKIIGIMGSHRKGHNTEFALNCALESARQLGDWVETEVISLHNLNINPCLSTVNCYFSGTYDLPCPDWGEEDDLNRHRILQKMMEADGIIVASPVYFGSVSGKLKLLFDRTVPCCHGNSVAELSGKLENKVGGAIAVSLAPHGGVEFTLNTIYMWMINHDMIVVGPGMYPPVGCITGGGAYEMLSQEMLDKKAIRTDIYGMRSIRHVGKRVAEVAAYIKLSRQTAEELAEKFKPVFKEGKVSIDWETYYQHNPHLNREHVGLCEYVGISKKGFEKYMEFQEKIAGQADKKGMTFGKGMKDPGFIRKNWISKKRVAFLSDEQIYHYNPEFWDTWVKKGTA